MGKLEGINVDLKNSSVPQIPHSPSPSHILSGDPGGESHFVGEGRVLKKKERKRKQVLDIRWCVALQNSTVSNEILFLSIAFSLLRQKLNYI